MGKNNKLVFSLLIALVIAVAVLSSFGMNIFGPGTPEIQLPSLSQDKDATSLDGDMGEGEFVQVAITPQTVQSVIAGLNRWASYGRTVTVEVYYGDQASGTFVADVWVDQGWTRVELATPMPAVGMQYTIVGEDTLYRWYGNDRAVTSWPAQDNDPDLAQRIPTYQDVLDLDSDQIVDADYVERDGLACIYVETWVPELAYSERFWVSVDNGLLIAAETWQEEDLLLQMTSSSVNALALDAMDFALPDGTVLHQPTGMVTG